ncbi:hypothetical protein H1164_15660 [Thermoactinomyces daqus]|uniref:Uncharacterized protein n=1 Tax=Thermoactinomyces daqus TaxID=1329516 RepID=A0A7W2AJY9_9BACL|nr:hypothetical protein [Thermoactinomyces daqus]MBA4544289.1 hypothetical protein [Thermoactinomyces daqus]
MPKIEGSKVKIAPRISLSIDAEIRRISKEDYGREDRVSAVIEDAVTHYSAARQSGNQLEQVLSATEGALLNRVNEKFEKEFDAHLKRVGDLIAKQSYYAVYGALVAEELLRKNLSKNSFKEVKTNRWNKAHEILEGHYEEAGGKEVAHMLQENQQLQAENEKLKKEIEQLRERNSELSSAKLEADRMEKKAKEIEQYYTRMIENLASKAEKTTFGNKYTLPFSIEDFVKAYQRQVPKP